jgi:hypothetical protein
MSKKKVTAAEIVDEVSEEGQEAVEVMRKAAVKALKTNNAEIATCLVNNAKKGHAASAKLLCELAVTPKKSAKKKRPSRANALAKEPEWTGETSNEEDAA